MIAFFGCWDEPGHYLWFPPKKLISGRELEAKRIRMPTAAQLDGSILFLPRPEAIGKGALTHLPALNTTILAWWGSPFDNRPGTNNAVIASDIWGETEMWHQFERDFPEISGKLQRPSSVITTFRWQGT